MQKAIPVSGTESDGQHRLAHHPSRPWYTSEKYGRAPTMDVAREFRDNQYVYTLISERNRGLCVGVNLIPDKQCNFNCIYCEVDRSKPGRPSVVDVDMMERELRDTLALVTSNQLRNLPSFKHLPEDLRNLRAVTLSGEGESTLCPNFAEVVRAVVHVRAQGEFPFFKIVMLTNGSGLDQPQVQLGLSMLTALDEIWIKLDSGTQEHMDRVNQPTQVTLDQVLKNILLVGRTRPVIIQSLFPMIAGEEPTPKDVDDYIERLRELKAAGAQIAMVQVYSAHRQAVHPDCSHLQLRSLSRIAQIVRDRTGISVEVF